MAKIVNLYKSKSDIWYYLIAYIEVSVLCLYGDILPSDSKAMDWCKGVFWQIHNSQIFYALNFALLLIGAVYMLDKQLPRKVFRLSRCLVYGISIILVVICTSKHPLAIEYFSLAFSFLFCLLILELSKFFSGSKNSIVSNADGFVADCYSLDELQNVGWDKYAESLLARLEKTNTGEKAFALSIKNSITFTCLLINLLQLIIGVMGMRK